MKTLSLITAALLAAPLLSAPHSAAAQGAPRLPHQPENARDAIAPYISPQEKPAARLAHQPANPRDAIAPYAAAPEPQAASTIAQPKKAKTAKSAKTKAAKHKKAKPTKKTKKAAHHKPHRNHHAQDMRPHAALPHKKAIAEEQPVARLLHQPENPRDAIAPYVPPGSVPVSAPPAIAAAPSAEPAQAPPTPAIAQPGPPAPFKPNGFIEGGGHYHLVSNNGDWYGQYVKGQIWTDPANGWNAELANLGAFGDHGVFGAIGNTHFFNPDWYSYVTVGASTDGFFLPRWRADAFLNRKWLENRNLITTIGVGDYEMRDGHSIYSLFLGGTYYFQDPWIVEGGVRFYVSTPQSVFSAYPFVAVTQGRNKDYYLTLRLAMGNEAYAIIGPNQPITNFFSEEVSLNWRQWWGDDWGTNIRTEAYHNPYYDRLGLIMGVFKEF